jgi:ribosomal protein S18 acetylase RimI-like enzyme
MMLGILFLFNNAKLFAMQTTEEIQDFDMQQHGEQVEQMLVADREELFANPEFKIVDMLLGKTITPQVKDSHNSLIMQVLKSTFLTKHPICSFVAYEKSGQNAFIRLLVTHGEVRGNGHATRLIRHVIVSLAQQGVTQLKIETREQNSGAVNFYDKLLSSVKDVSYLKNDIKVADTTIFRYVITLLQKGIA